MHSLQHALLSILRDGFDQLWSCFPRRNRSYFPILQINYAGDPGIPWVYFLKLRNEGQHGGLACIKLYSTKTELLFLKFSTNF